MVSRHKYYAARRRRRRRRLALLFLTLALALSALTGTALLRGSQASAEVAPIFSAVASSDASVDVSPPVTASGTTLRFSPSTTVVDTPAAGEPPSVTTSVSSSTTTVTIYTHAISRPVRVVVPTVEIDAVLMEVGLREEGVAEVPPFGRAAWYKLGPAPGANGPAVLLGHVDSTKGPDVFYRLRDIMLGDTVVVYGEDGDVATFFVDGKEQVLKTELPTERIWNGSQQPLIRLITCGGEFDHDTGHYLSNLIVYGHLVR